MAGGQNGIQHSVIGYFLVGMIAIGVWGMRKTSTLNDNLIPGLGAALATDEKKLILSAAKDAELLLIDTAL